MTSLCAECSRNNAGTFRFSLLCEIAFERNIMDNWKINFKKLKGPDRRKWKWLTDEYYYSPNGKILCLIYSIAETSMGWYTGKLAIFINEKDPKILFDTSAINCHGYNNHIQYLYGSDYISVRVKIFDAINNSLFIPLVIFDLQNSKFSVIPLINGNDYRLSEISETSLRLIEMNRNEHFVSYDNMVFELNHLKWSSIHELPNLSDALIHYFKNKIGDYLT